MKIGSIIVRNIDGKRFKVVRYDKDFKIWYIDDLKKQEKVKA
jgi:hypothetical protein